jgi:MinD-like ATPase involved in chromosome partitioning or flagellar assembly
MAGDRFVLLGLARPRAPWFTEVSRWSTSAIVPAEFVKCVSVEELRARLGSGRTWSAVLLDGSLPSVDRDVVAAARDAGCAAIVVDDRSPERWRAIGVAAVLPTGFDRGALLDVLDAVASAVRGPVGLDLDAVGRDAIDRDALVVTVCGPGGTGASSTAIALAQGLASATRSVVLADLARHAELAVLHDVRDVVPGVQELVEAHRNGVPSVDDVRALTFDIVERGYALLLGLRRARYWPSLRPRSFAAAFDSLTAAFDVVVCDVAADLEREGDAGSVDVEERNVATLTAVDASDVVLAVGRPGVKGVHALVRVVADLGSAGVPADRILPVVTCAPRSPRAKAELASTVAELAAPALGGMPVSAPLFLPVRNVDAAVRDGAPLPAPLPVRVRDAVLAMRDRVGPRHRAFDEPVPVTPGDLGSFSL